LWCYCCCHLVLFCDGNKEGPVGRLGCCEERERRLSRPLYAGALFSHGLVYRVIDGYQHWYEQWYQIPRSVGYELRQYTSLIPIPVW
jgi:hypothetical protein